LFNQQESLTEPGSKSGHEVSVDFNGRAASRSGDQALCEGPPSGTDLNDSVSEAGPECIKDAANDMPIMEKVLAKALLGRVPVISRRRA
jgi:hypothetical protein